MSSRSAPRGPSADQFDRLSERLRLYALRPTGDERFRVLALALEVLGHGAAYGDLVKSTLEILDSATQPDGKRVLPELAEYRRELTEQILADEEERGRIG